jgi:hypothetical protein
MQEENLELHSLGRLKNRFGMIDILLHTYFRPSWTVLVILKSAILDFKESNKKYNENKLTNTNIPQVYICPVSAYCNNQSSGEYPYK